jgi:hypothetical protein
MFQPQHQPAIEKLADGEATVLEGLIDGRSGRLNVSVTGLAPGAGLAFFEADGEPY